MASSAKPTDEQIAQLRDQFFEKYKNTPNKDDLFHPKDIERINTNNVWIEKFLDHCEFDVKNAVQMLWETCEWRKSFGANDINDKNLNTKYLKEGLAYPRNRDVNGKVIFIFKSKLHFKGLRDANELLRMFVYWMDRLQRQENYDSITIFFDLAETSLSNMDLDYTKNIVNILKYYYPASVHSIILFEQPWIFSAAIKIIKAIMPPKAVAAIKTVTMKNIREYISEENMLKSWGGQDDYVYSFEPEYIEENGVELNVTPVNSRKVHFANQNSPQSPISENSSPSMSPDKYEGTLLRVSPNDAIHFAKSGNEMVGTVEITNISQSTITYKVKTTSPEKFRVRPSTGILTPGAITSINVILHQGQQSIALSKDKFLVMAMEITLDATTSPQEIAEFWKMTPSNSAAVEQHRLKCIQPPISMNDNSENKNGSVLTGAGMDGDRQMSQLSLTMSELVHTTNRLESQMRHYRNLQLITLIICILLSIATIYILNGTIQNNSEFCLNRNS